VRIEACRHEHQLGRVGAGGGQHHAVEQRQPQLLACAGRHGQVDVVALARPRAAVVQAAAAGIQRALVQAHEQHVAARTEDLCGAVAVVDVPVDHEHAADAVLGDRRGGADGDVVEQAEAHRARALGVVAGGSHAAEGDRRLAREQRAHHLARGARGVQRRRPRALADERVGIDRPASGLAQRADALDVLARVRELERRRLDRRREPALVAEPFAPGELALEHAQALGRVRMPGPEHARIVLEAGRVRKVQRCARAAASGILVHCLNMSQASMRAMVFERVGEPLRAVERPLPRAEPGQLLIEVAACGVCRTDLHLLDGEIEIAAPPRILGHQIVGTVHGSDRRVGVPWLGWTCGRCRWCRSGRENLCPQARFTGRDIDGGMAEYTVADARFCFDLADEHPDGQIAPLMCAGVIGYRALRMCGEAQALGLYGFGASAHILVQLAIHQGRRVYAFTRAGDDAAQALARELGATWAGGSEELPPEPLDAAIIFAPVGALVPQALRAVGPGGTVVCGGIHMSDIPSFPYRELWEERSVRSVANLTREDARELLALAPRVPVQTHVTTYPLDQATRALEDLRAGRFTGAAVIVP
jgi:propanol-preferring alcohol dehydrogenase